MLQNTYGNKGLDTLFGPGRIPDFWTPIVKNIRVFVHPIKKPSQAQGFWAYMHASGCLLVRSFRKHNTQLASLSWPKPVCLWWFLYFQARSMHVCMYACMQASGSSKNQVSTRLSRMLQNTYAQTAQHPKIFCFCCWKSKPRHVRLGISLRSVALELKFILMRRANSEYVCMYVY